MWHTEIGVKVRLRIIFTIWGDRAIEIILNTETNGSLIDRTYRTDQTYDGNIHNQVRHTYRRHQKYPQTGEGLLSPKTFHLVEVMCYSSDSRNICKCLDFHSLCPSSRTKVQLFCVHAQCIFISRFSTRRVGKCRCCALIGGH